MNPAACPSCGSINPEAALFCEFCKAVLHRKGGAKVPAAAHRIDQGAPTDPGLPTFPPRAAAHPNVPVVGMTPHRPPPVQPAVPATWPPASTGFSTWAVAVIALLSGGLGYTLRGFLTAAPRAEPTAIVSPPPGAPAPVAITPPPKPTPTPVLPVEQPAAPVLAPAPAPAPAAPPALVVADPKRITVAYEPLEGTAQRIIIPVTINGSLTVPMALDTGAPSTHISTRLAARLGVLHDGDSRLLTAASGIGGSSAAALVILDSIAVGEARTEFVPATVTESISDAFEGLVGMDFVAGYSLNIDSAQHVLVLTELPPGASAPAGHDEAWWRRNFRLLAGQRSTWKNIHSIVVDRVTKSDVSAGGDAELLKKLLTFAESQDREAEALHSRLERYAATHSVPLEWRKQ